MCVTVLDVCWLTVWLALHLSPKIQCLVALHKNNIKNQIHIEILVIFQFFLLVLTHTYIPCTFRALHCNRKNELLPMLVGMLIHTNASANTYKFHATPTLWNFIFSQTFVVVIEFVASIFPLLAAYFEPNLSSTHFSSASICLFFWFFFLLLFPFLQSFFLFFV